MYLRQYWLQCIKYIQIIENCFYLGTRTLFVYGNIFRTNAYTSRNGVYKFLNRWLSYTNHQMWNRKRSFTFYVKRRWRMQAIKKKLEKITGRHLWMIPKIVSNLPQEVVIGIKDRWSVFQFLLRHHFLRSIRTIPDNRKQQSIKQNLTSFSS